MVKSQGAASDRRHNLDCLLLAGGGQCFFNGSWQVNNREYKVLHKVTGDGEGS